MRKVRKSLISHLLVSGPSPSSRLTPVWNPNRPLRQCDRYTSNWRRRSEMILYRVTALSHAGQTLYVSAYPSENRLIISTEAEQFARVFLVDFLFVLDRGRDVVDDTNGFTDKSGTVFRIERHVRCRRARGPSRRKPKPHSVAGKAPNKAVSA